VEEAEVEASAGIHPLDQYLHDQTVQMKTMYDVNCMTQSVSLDNNEEINWTT